MFHHKNYHVSQMVSVSTSFVTCCSIFILQNSLIFLLSNPFIFLSFWPLLLNFITIHYSHSVLPREPLYIITPLCSLLTAISTVNIPVPPYLVYSFATPAFLISYSYFFLDFLQLHHRLLHSSFHLPRFRNT